MLSGGLGKAIPYQLEGGLGEFADPACYDECEAVDMVLQPGEFFLFNENTLHSSGSNNSDRRRLGLAIRAAPGHVRVDSPAMFPGYKVLEIAGKNQHSDNDVGVSPPTISD